MAERPCPACGGSRLRPETLAVKIGGPLDRRRRALHRSRTPARSSTTLALGEREQAIARRVLKEIRERLGFLQNVGLDYLTLDRAAGTLSGGEGQRIRLATQIGSSLVGVLYILDEPSIGLHQRDNRPPPRHAARGCATSATRCSSSSTTRRRSAPPTHVIDLGPGRGRARRPRRGRRARPTEIMANPKSLTGRYLSGASCRSRCPRRGAPGTGKFLTIHDAARAQPQGHARPHPARHVHLRHRRVGLRASPRSSTTSSTGRWPRCFHRAQERPGAHDRIEGDAAPRQGHRHRPVADRPHPALQPGDVHRRLHVHPRAVRADARRAGARLRSRAASRST